MLVCELVAVGVEDGEDVPVQPLHQLLILHHLHSSHTTFNAIRNLELQVHFWVRNCTFSGMVQVIVYKLQYCTPLPLKADEVT